MNLKTIIGGLLMVSFTGLAQTPPPWAWAKAVPQVAGTQQMFGLAADTEGNAIVVGQIMEAVSPYENGMVVAKYSADGNKAWATGFPGVLYNGSTFMSAVCDADLNVYAVLHYTSGTITVNGNDIDDSDFALVKLDKDGAVLWAKAIGADGQDELISMSIEGDQVIVMAHGLASFTRDGYNYDIPLWGTNYMTAYNFDGNLQQFGVMHQSSSNTLQLVTRDGADYYGYVNTPTVMKQKLNTTTLEPETVATLDLVNQPNGYELAVTDIVSSTSGRVFASGFFKSDYVLLEGDTVENLNGGYPTCFILELDDALNVVNYITYYDVWGLQNQNIIQQLAVHGNEKLAVHNWFYSKIKFPDDSLEGTDGQRFAAITELNFDLTVKSMSRTKVNDQAGWNSTGIVYDGGGNLYVMYRHEEDVFFDSIHVASANKSWEHLSALGRLNSGALLSVTESPASDQSTFLYPNPANDQLFVNAEQGSVQLSFMDVSGKTLQVSTVMAQHSLSISELPAGVYIVKMTNDDGAERYQRLIKQ